VNSGRAAHVQTHGEARLFAAERLRHVEQIFDAARITPEIELPVHLDTPATAAELSERLGLSVAALETPLAALEAAGVVLSGRFDPLCTETQFCDRGLLARIHRYTLVRLRREIEPVSARDFLRFLTRWQHLDPDTQLLGQSGTQRVIDQLSGFEAAVAAWEGDLLPSRVDGYKPELLDTLCLGGSVAWGRLTHRALESGSQPSRATPLGLFPRQHLFELLHAARNQTQDKDETDLRGPAQRCLELLEARGALFARELEAVTRLLPAQVEEGLKELVARGRVTCDGFAPLRRLLSGARRHARPERRGRVLPRGLSGLPGPEGRWALLQAEGECPLVDDQAEAAAWRLLERYGVVFRDLLAREWLPGSWREVHRALRRLEARGLVRGGRFVTGFSGEQFALPDAVTQLRRERKRELTGVELRVSASDPLNLVGILTPGQRLPAGHLRWLIYRDGLPVAALERGQRSEIRMEAAVARS